jgi:hypothetical protein
MPTRLEKSPEQQDGRNRVGSIPFSSGRPAQHVPHKVRRPRASLQPRTISMGASFVPLDARARPVSQLRRHHRPPPLPTRALDARELALLVGNCCTSCAHPPPGRPPPETHPLDSLLVRSAAGAARVEQFGAPADEEEQRQIILFCRSRLGERNVPGGEAGQRGRTMTVAPAVRDRREIWALDGCGSSRWGGCKIN